MEGLNATIIQTSNHYHVVSQHANKSLVILEINTALFLKNVFSDIK